VVWLSTEPLSPVGGEYRDMAPVRAQPARAGAPRLRGRETPRFVLDVAVLLAAVGAFALWIGLRIGGTRCVLIVDDVGTALAALAATALCARAAVRQGGRLRLTWWLLAGACVCWALAEITWAVYDLVLDQAVPVPSWADVGYLGAIPLAVGALWFHPALRATQTQKVRTFFDGLVIATALLLTSWTLVLGPLWRSTDLSSLGGVVALAYPFGDVVIIFFVLLAIRRVRDGTRSTLVCLLGGLLAMALADSTYTYLSETHAYATSNLIDTGWFAAYLGIGLAAFWSGSGLERATPTAGLAATTRTSFLTPFVPALLALGVVGVELTLGHKLDGPATGMALALVALVLVRQALLALELAAPAQSAEATWLTDVVRVALGRTTTTPEPDPRRHSGAHA
jgi:hypothetical protein